MTNQTGKFNKGQNAGTAKCGDCGKTFQKGNMQRLDNGTTGYNCNRCFDRAGDENAVADGYMTCADFKARYGEHSDYCDCKVEAAAAEEAIETRQEARRSEIALEAIIADTKNDKRECLCGCGGSPKGKRSRYLPGHDAKHAAARKVWQVLGVPGVD